jgi:hypothetical protein
MDPNETLRLARDIARDTVQGSEETPEALRELAEHFLAIDDWLVAGGFLPDAWRRAA